MTNETTASQPKSIGDDAQFRELILVWKFADSQEKSDIACRKVIEHLDSRAPAAQASATIQEPVMVAEPVGDGLPPEVQKLFDQLRPEIDYWCAHRRESNLAALDAIEFRFKVSQARTVRLESTALAAPMVADPAGVAVGYITKEVAAVLSRGESYATDICVERTEIYSEPLFAATVKAVPSEACRQYYYKVDGCKADKPSDASCICWHDEGTGPMGNRPYEVRSWRFAAPLADKTGGGE